MLACQTHREERIFGLGGVGTLRPFALEEEIDWVVVACQTHWEERIFGLGGVGTARFFVNGGKREWLDWVEMGLFDPSSLLH